MIPISHITGRLGNQMFQYAYIYAQYRKGILPDVYLQDPKYFAEYRNEIRALFGSGIAAEPVDHVAIHVRRGDYVDNDFYVDLSKDGYYERAMAEFPDAEFVVFSDDILWCEQQEIFRGCAFSHAESDVDDMNLMASCKGIIMANSSFSWWAAYLSKAKIVAPAKWFTDGQKRVGLLDSWKVI